MTKIKGISQEDENFIFRTIQSYFPKAEIIIFGSRISGKCRKYSDIDICIKADSPLNLATWSKLEETFANSDLEWIVDLSDYHLLTDDFRKHVLDTGAKV